MEIFIDLLTKLLNSSNSEVNLLQQASVKNYIDGQLKKFIEDVKLPEYLK